MNIKLIICNLGFIEDINKLKDIAKILKNFDADVILFQEVKKYPERESSIHILNKFLNYSNVEFVQSHDHSKDYGKGKIQDTIVFEGLGILSNQAFKSVKKELPIQKGIDRWPRISVKYGFGGFSIVNLHLSKHQESRELEVLELEKADILAGDFNMFPPEFLKFASNRENSYSFSNYTSYPSKNQTLDYVLLNRGKIIKMKIIEKISDHNSIFINLSL